MPYEYSSIHIFSLQIYSFGWQRKENTNANIHRENHMCSCNIFCFFFFFCSFFSRRVCELRVLWWMESEWTDNVNVLALMLSSKTLLFEQFYFFFKCGAFIRQLSIWGAMTTFLKNEVISKTWSNSLYLRVKKSINGQERGKKT